MRLIDADALFIDASFFNDELDRAERFYSEEQIKNAPTVDRAQGEWNISDYKSVCSVCGADETDFIYGTEIWYGLGESKFCPNCGARMKGVSDDA